MYKSQFILDEKREITGEGAAPRHNDRTRLQLAKNPWSLLRTFTELTSSQRKSNTKLIGEASASPFGRRSCRGQRAALLDALPPLGSQLSRATSPKDRRLLIRLFGISQMP